MKKLLILAVLALGCTEEKAPEPPPVKPEPIKVPAPEPDPEPDPEPEFKYLIGSYQTPVKRTKDRNREHNVELAARQFDEVILLPGASFSYNEAVGKRSKERGFKPAPVIFDGVLMDGVGGGACQVSSTLHAALLKSGIEPTERSHHSRPSSYIDIGYDAAVSWPDVCETDPPQCIKLDLKFKNTFSFPIQLRVNYFTPELEEEKGDVLQIAIYGTEENTRKVEFRTRWHETEDYQVIERPKGWGSRRTKIQNGKKGRSATLYITTTDKGTGYKTVRKLHSRYKPTNEVWEVGPDYVPDEAPYDPKVQ